MSFLTFPSSASATSSASASASASSVRANGNLLLFSFQATLVFSRTQQPRMYRVDNGAESVEREGKRKEGKKDSSRNGPGVGGWKGSAVAFRRDSLLLVVVPCAVCCVLVLVPVLVLVLAPCRAGYLLPILTCLFPLPSGFR
ncbi:hypothetical protein F4802DRAFT_516428 [Xylaria palmicola]|nr:hypothetical protein F4802DRAFT_516428 [Xylaria palmicola]